MASVTLKVATPLASVVPEMAVTADDPEVGVSVTAVPAGTGAVTLWVFLPSTVTVTVEESLPSATAVAGAAVTVDRLASGVDAGVGMLPSPGLTVPVSPASVLTTEKPWDQTWGSPILVWSWPM